MSRENRICACCRSFSLAAAPEQAAHGIGACLAYDTPVEPFVRWDGPFCVLFGRAKDMGPRLRYVEKMTQKEEA